MSVDDLWDDEREAVLKELDKPTPVVCEDCGEAYADAIPCRCHCPGCGRHVKGGGNCGECIMPYEDLNVDFQGRQAT